MEDCIMKKIYEKPVMMVIYMANETLLAGSEGSDAIRSNDTYNIKYGGIDDGDLDPE